MAIDLLLSVALIAVSKALPYVHNAIFSSPKSWRSAGLMILPIALRGNAPRTTQSSGVLYHTSDVPHSATSSFRILPSSTFVLAGCTNATVRIPTRGSTLPITAQAAMPG